MFRLFLCVAILGLLVSLTEAIRIEDIPEYLTADVEEPQARPPADWSLLLYGLMAQLVSVHLDHNISRHIDTLGKCRSSRTKSVTSSLNNTYYKDLFYYLLSKKV